MKRFMRVLHWLTQHPVMKVLIGVILFSTGLFETWHIMHSSLDAPAIGAHHGAMAFGGFYAIKNIPDLYEGIGYFVENEEL